MPVKKIHVEFDDSAGNKYELTFTGEATRQKAKYLLELVELLGDAQKEPLQATAEGSKLDRLCSLVRTGLSARWFASNEVQAVYEEKYGVCLALSTVCTYLARLTDRGVLMRRGPANSLEYRVVAIAQETASLTNDSPARPS